MRPAFLQASAVDVDHLEAWREEPDVVEGDERKLTPPLSGYTDTTEDSGQLVAETFPEVEAGVGEFPDTVDTVGSIRLCQYILKPALKKIRKKHTS